VGVGTYVGRTFRSALFLCTIVLAACIASKAAPAQSPPAAASVKDKVYTKEQAARGEKLFTETCAKCHKFTAPETKDGPLLGGDVFLGKWDGKSVYELAFGIKLSMPPDGSVILDDAQTMDLVSFILKSNAFPDGTKPLKMDDAAKSVTIVKVK
jgi:mono/diheme cytochrome c family protein